MILRLEPPVFADAQEDDAVDRHLHGVIQIRFVVDFFPVPQGDILRQRLAPAFDLIQERRYGQALQSFAAMAPELEAFFKDVMVMVEDENLCRNRMSLLRKVSGTVLKIADVTKIVVARSDYKP